MHNFQDHAIWKNDRLFKQLKWYYQVMNNDKPAKYLIARRIKYTINPSADLDSLISVFKELSREFENKYIQVYQGESLGEVQHPNLLDLCVQIVTKMLEYCNLCGLECGVDRTKAGKRGICQLDEESRISSFFHHRGEEMIFRGTHGSGTIFFTSCNLQCVFCQNGDISNDKDNGLIFDAYGLAAMIKLLRFEGAHNINFVGGDPIIHLHTIIGAIHLLDLHPIEDRVLQHVQKVKADYFIQYPSILKQAEYDDEFNAPMLWNSNFYMSDLSFSLLSILIDIWLPDLKYFNNDCARRLSKIPKYVEKVTGYIKRCYDNRENVVIRHLILPNHIECCSIPMLEWIHNTVPEIPINLMDQYHPDYKTDPTSQLYEERYCELNRHLRNDEIERVLNRAKALNINFELVTNV
ncbi:MAG: 4Fe-4S cluster-binding domain-containing protein [Candidatus Heimdallarchaeota archaeon]|nr:4Fe-4S cluster-binding domain-containing protein [Candidatus Heimdallarchaeota archaeon]